MFEIMLIIEGEQVVYHSYDSNIAPVKGDMITIGEKEVFEVNRRLLGGLKDNNKIILFGTVQS